MKVALLGLSHPHAEMLCVSLEHLAEVSELILWDSEPGIAARWESRRGSKPAAVTTSLDTALASGATFAVLCLPGDRSAAVARRVLESGLHLLTEKPAGIVPEEIAALAALAAQRRLVASVLYPRRFHPCMAAARRWIQDGKIGRLYSVEARFLTTQVQFRDPSSWLFRRNQAGGGILLWLGCHCLDLIYYLTGDTITEVAAALVTRSSEAIDVEDTAALTYRLSSGAIGTLLTGYALAYSGSGYTNQAGNDSYLGFNGRLGRIVWPDLEPRLQVEFPPAAGEPAVRDETFACPASPFYGGTGGEALLRQFLLAVAGRGAPPTTLDDALRTARIIAAAERSSRSGRFESALT